MVKARLRRPPLPNNLCFCPWLYRFFPHSMLAEPAIWFGVCNLDHWSDVSACCVYFGRFLVVVSLAAPPLLSMLLRAFHTSFISLCPVW
ncbi:hypothetical protein BOTBODRAFT_488028 [Botryobasidium botryosum FD-172 SS1]|uniref:Uncharacterized protein n=1 Tax=Botryobasidium botryosum (strain FD-172 SS1) TaxID=930990 RepID=A0A067M4J2_BOTB1|nr:hypothetical protein BOTBODRAFT_488028 [Botryobasidium botryosum FD-172 SS1]